MPELEYLEWDSTFFGLKIGRILVSQPDWMQITKILHRAKLHQYQLIYLITSGTTETPRYILNEFNGKLVDKKVVFVHDKITDTDLTTLVQEYPANAPLEPLISLALLSGAYSRFKMDTNFPIGSFERLYQAWINKSVLREIADVVYVVSDGTQIAGMMTVSFNPTKATIGLIAVSPETQGKRVGTALIKRLKQACIQKTIYAIEVATQGDNIAACRFYEKNGFNIFSQNNIYHFWLT